MVTILTRGCIAGDFSLGKFNVTLDCFCCWPIGTTVDSMRENPDVIPPKSAPSRGGSGPHLIIVPWALPSPHPKRYLDWFSHFAGLTVVTCRQTDRQTDHAHLYVAIGRI